MAKQTTFKAADAMAGGNISLSFGIMELVRKGFRRLHLYDFLNGFKEKGVPLRVWSRSSVRGLLMLALIAQLQISMLRYDMEPDPIEKMVDGRRTIVEHKPSAKTIIENLIHWTVTLIP